MAFRSSDGGESWHGPGIAFAIDYNQHGFVPFIPRGGSRIYSFGTQPVWERYTPNGVSRRTPLSATAGPTMTGAPGAKCA